MVKYFLTLVSLAFAFASPSISWPAETVVSTTSQSGLLGSAYRTDQERFVGPGCLEGETGFTGASESSFSFDQTTTEEQLAKELGFSVGAKARYGLYEGGLAADFFSRSLSNA